MGRFNGDMAGATGFLETLSKAFLTSGSHTFTAPGKVRITVVGAGGSGARLASANAGCATGGNSAPWGVKVIPVNAGDVLTVNLGAGGASPPTINTNGLQGGTTTIQLNGVTIMTVQGGEGGAYGAMKVPATPVSATVTGADYWVPGVQAGSPTNGGSGQISGGAAVDVMATGLGSSRSDNITVIVSGGSVGSNDSGAGLPFDFSIFGFASGGSSSPGAIGVGGETTRSFAGILAGGAGVNSGDPTGVAKLGGGGGGGLSQLNNVGGQAYAFMVFVPK